MRTHLGNNAILTRSAAILVIAAATLIFSATAAFADPIADAQTRAKQVQGQVSALQTKAEIASEQYNEARMHYTSLSSQVDQSKHNIAKLDAQKSRLQKTLDTRASSLYRQGPLGFLSVLLEARNLSDLDSAYQIVTNVNRRDALTVEKLKATKVQAAAAQKRLVSQQNQAGSQQRAMADNASQVKSQLAASKQVLAQADTAVQNLIAQQKAREAAAAAAEAARVVAAAERAARIAATSRASGSSSGDQKHSSGGGSSSGSSSGSSGGGNPPASGRGAKAVYWAETRLGDPYVWGAAGPNSFDCSGLTMWAYKKAGVSMNHYSRDQINEGKRVSKSNLQPGDLVFFGSPIHHVGMYVGSGKFIEAPYTGANVRISRLSNRDDFAGACRP